MACGHASGRGLVNYDTLYALVWGRDLAHGTAPDLDVPLAPTPHPLADARRRRAAPLSSAADRGVHGEAATTVVLVVAFAALGALGWVVYRLGAEWFNPAAGVLAAAIVLTRRPGARLRRARLRRHPVPRARARRAARRDAPARAPARRCSRCSRVAGLLRPEAWLFSVAYLAWLWSGARARALACSSRSPPRRRCCGRSATSLVTGDPLHSLLGTRDTARRRSQRITGLDDVPLHGAAAPRRDPARAGAARRGGRRRRSRSLWLRDGARRSASRPGVVAIAAFCVLAAAGLPILGRYLLLPAAILAIFCGAGAFGWLQLPRGDPRRRRWAWFGVVDAGAARRLHARRRSTGVARAARRPRAPGHDPGRPAALVRIPPAAIRALRAGRGARTTGRSRCSRSGWTPIRPQDRLGPGRAAAARGHLRDAGDAAVAHDYILDPRDLDQAIPPPPAGLRLAGANARGASSRALLRRRWTVHPPSKSASRALRVGARLRHGDPRCAHR